MPIDEHLYNPHSFFWDSDLTDERKIAINRWILTLPTAQNAMLKELLQDEHDATDFEVRDEYASQDESY